MEIKDKAELCGAQPAARIVYTPPALREFGPVGALTQAGTGAMGEYMGPIQGCGPVPRSDDRC